VDSEKVEPGVAFKRTKSTRSFREVWYFLILWNVSPDLKRWWSEREGGPEKGLFLTKSEKEIKDPLSQSESRTRESALRGVFRSSVT
jgi:hypothetical protein